MYNICHFMCTQYYTNRTIKSDNICRSRSFLVPLPSSFITFFNTTFFDCQQRFQHVEFSINFCYNDIIEQNANNLLDFRKIFLIYYPKYSSENIKNLMSFEYLQNFDQFYPTSTSTHKKHFQSAKRFTNTFQNITKINCYGLIVHAMQSKLIISEFDVKMS